MITSSIVLVLKDGLASFMSFSFSLRNYVGHIYVDPAVLSLEGVCYYYLCRIGID